MWTLPPCLTSCLEWAHRICRGQLIDGRNRAIACERLGIELDACELGADTDPIKWSMSFNIHRRHLTISEKAQVGVKLKELLEPEAKERKKQGQANGRKSQAGALVAKLPPTEKSRDKAANALGISGKLVDAAERVEKKGTPELNAAVTSGKVSVSRASKIADAPKEKQNNLIGKPAPKAERSVFTDLRKIFDAMTEKERGHAAFLWESWQEET